MEIQIPKTDGDKIMGLLMALSQEFPECTHDLLMITRSAKNGITVEISPLKIKHTDPQRGYYHLWKNEFAKWAGNTPDEMHDHILGEAYGNEVRKTALGQKIRPMQRSADASVDEYSHLIETLIRIAAEFGFVVPPAVRMAATENEQ